MITVFKKEFSSAFHRLYGYVTVGIMLFVAAILFKAYNLTYTAESISTVCSGMSIVAALVIPVIAVNAFPSRRKEDTDAVYGMMPVRSCGVVIGKYLAALATVMLSNILLAVLPALSGFFGEVDHKASYTALLGLVFFEAAWLAVCIFIAKCSRSRVTAYLLSYIICVVWYFLATVSILIPTTRRASLIGFAVFVLLVAVLCAVATRKIYVGVVVFAFFGGVLALVYALFKDSFAGLFEAFVGKLSVFEQFNTFSYGVLDLDSVLFFVILTCLFVFLTWRAYEKKYEKREAHPVLSLKRATSVGLALTLVLSSLVLTCAASAVPDSVTSYDATAAHKNSVSDEAKEFLGSVEKDVTVYLLEPTGLEGYELYLDKLAASGEHITLKKVFYSDEPSFYTERGISKDTISANSLVIECGDRYNYLSYYNLFVYSNETLGATDMTYSEYAYYRQIFASSEDYYDYYLSLVYDTTVYFNADYMICTYIEYTAADIIPANYYLTGHGEADITDGANAYYGWGIEELSLADGIIPADAASIFINMPENDITEAERDMLLEYLAGGGQLTFVTDSACLDMPNLCAVLAKYGMSARKGAVCERVTEEDGEDTETVTSEFTPEVNTDNDVLCYLDGTSGFAPEVRDANAIAVDENAMENMTVIPLLSSSSESFIGDGEPASYTLACAVETPDGAKLVWFTGGESFNEANSDASTVVLYALSWVTLEYESSVDGIPSRIYSMPTSEVSGTGANILFVVLITLAIAVPVCGGVIFYARKKSK